MINDGIHLIQNFLENWSLFSMSLSEIIDVLTDALPYFDSFLDYISPISYFIPWSHIRVILGIILGTIGFKVLVSIWKLLPTT